MIKVKKYLWTLPYIVGFVLWAVFYRVCPLFYDMYVMKVDYLVRNSTFVGVLKAIFFTGGAWRNARYFENVISIYFASYEWISDFLMPFVFVLGVFFAQKAVTEKKKWYITIMGFGLFWCVSHGIVGQCYSYFYVLFLFPIFLVPLLIYVINGYMDGEIKIEKWYQKLLFLLLVYSNASFGEHISCAFSLLMIWYLVKDRIKRKKFDRLLLTGAIIALLQTIYMNMYLIVLQTRPLAEDASSLADIIKYNFRVLIIESWLSNPVIIIPFLVVLICAVRNNKIWAIIDSVITACYIIWISLIQSAGGFDTACYKIEPDTVIPFTPENLWFVWGILYVGINLFILYQLFMTSERIAALFFMGGCSTVPVLVTPNTGWRISAFYVFMIILTTVALMSVREDSKGVVSLHITIGIAMAIAGIVLFIPRIDRIHDHRVDIEKVVEETRNLQETGKWSMERDVMYLPGYDRRDVISAGEFDDNTYYMWNFCYVNGLDKDTIVRDLEE